MSKEQDNLLKLELVSEKEEKFEFDPLECRINRVYKIVKCSASLHEHLGQLVICLSGPASKSFLYFKTGYLFSLNQMKDCKLEEIPCSKIEMIFTKNN